jgi:hypothetical protein
MMKYKSYKIVYKYKARLVVKGYTYSFDIDYQETSTHMAKMNIVRVILSLIVNMDRPLWQLDMKDVFLHNDLSEEVYIDHPLGFILEWGKIYKIKKCIDLSSH